MGTSKLSRHGLQLGFLPGPKHCTNPVPEIHDLSPRSELEPFSLPLIRNKCPKPLQWITPCRRWLCKSRNLPISPGSSPHEGHLRNLVTMGSLQLGHCSCALAPPWARFIPANLRDRSDVCSGAGIMKWYRMLETG
jgi:hypothetical protein